MEILGNQSRKVLLYTTGCPKCEIIKKKLTVKNIDFEEVNDKDEMIEKGITQVPMMEINDELLDFVKANDWINNRK